MCHVALKKITKNREGTTRLQRLKLKLLGTTGFSRNNLKNHRIEDCLSEGRHQLFASYSGFTLTIWRLLYFLSVLQTRQHSKMWALSRSIKNKTLVSTEDYVFWALNQVTSRPKATKAINYFRHQLLKEVGDDRLDLSYVIEKLQLLDTEVAKDLRRCTLAVFIWTKPSAK